MIGVALVEAADQRDVDGRADAVGPASIEEHDEQVAMQIVHGVVVGLDLEARSRSLVRMTWPASRAIALPTRPISAR